MPDLKAAAEDDEFDWVQIKAKLQGQHEESFTEKFNRKFGENPLIPIGSLMTIGCLTYGLVCFKRGDSKKSQVMMRWRIGAQGFTVVALVVGIGISALKSANQSSQKL